MDSGTEFGVRTPGSPCPWPGLWPGLLNPLAPSRQAGRRGKREGLWSKRSTKPQVESDASVSPMALQGVWDSEM